jgi:hypothetical protein
MLYEETSNGLQTVEPGLLEISLANKSSGNEKAAVEQDSKSTLAVNQRISPVQNQMTEWTDPAQLP